MKIKKLMILLFVVAFAFSAHAQSKKAVTELPDISVIGNNLGTFTDDAKTFEVKELEFSFQHYLYPNVKADVFTALHKEDGERSFELEEAKVSFYSLLDTLFPERESLFDVSAVVGKSFLGIGKDNALHPEQRLFVDRPLVAQRFLGGEESLAAEGAELGYLLPLPIFSKLTVGYWTADSHAHGEEEEESHEGVEFEDRIATVRLWNSFELGSGNDLQLGLNYLLGNASADADDQSTVIGLDLSYDLEVSNKVLKLSSEIYQAEYGHEGEEKESQNGYFVAANYKLNSSYNAGVRYGFVSKHGDEGEETSQLSLALTRQLTETSKFRLQYNTGEEVENTVYAQFIFGMGPHSHVLN